ncbi:MAG: cell division protein [Flavobacterium sp. BFFFF2]|nr:MAG: cell division protein [Flavobacterium sp. BFFFF2]
MPKIVLTTEIHATPDLCFDLSRSIDLHKISTAHTNEEAIAGTTSGLINLHQTVTWQATHFGVKQLLTSKITAFDRPHSFTDEQTKGIFKSFKHIHQFEKVGDQTMMTDIFEFQSPFGLLGHIFNRLILTRYMKKLLTDRNHFIKAFAETDQWREVIQESKD